MCQRSLDPVTRNSRRSSTRSTLDRAIIASVVAMAAMNIFVLSQQMQASPTIAFATTTEQAAQA
jgi:hypothetical protein